MKLRRVLLLMLAVMPLAIVSGISNPLIIASLISVGGGLLGSLMGGGAQASADEQLAFAKMLYDDYKEKYGPLEDAILNELNLPTEQSNTYRRATAVVEKQYGSMDAALRRRGVVGRPHGSGLDTAMRSQAAYRKADQRADIFANLDIARTGQKMNMLQIGKGGSSAEQNLANVYGQRTGIAAQNEAGAAQGFGATAGNLAQLYMMYNAAPSQTPGQASIPQTAGSLDSRINLPSSMAPGTAPRRPVTLGPSGAPDYLIS